MLKRVTCVNTILATRTRAPRHGDSLVVSATVAIFKNSEDREPSKAKNTSKTPTSTSFEQFYQNEYRSLVGLAYVMTGTMAEAEDITQEAFSEAHKRWKKIAAYDQPAGWLRNVLVNKATSRFRKLRSEAKALTRLTSQPQKTLEIAPASNEIWSTLRTLPPRQAQVLALRYWDDFTVQQIADTLGLGTETVKTHLSRAKMKMATLLADKGLDTAFSEGEK